MAIFIKISKDGKYLYCLKTLFNTNVSENEFIQRANIVPTKDFLQRYASKLDDSTLDKINRVKEISEMELSALGCMEIKSEGTEKMQIVCFAGDEIFKGENIEETKEEALDYAKRFYGSEFMKEKLDFLNSKEITCFSKKEPVSFKKYKALMNELEKLTKIMFVKKEYIKKH